MDHKKDFRCGKMIYSNEWFIQKTIVQLTYSLQIDTYLSIRHEFDVENPPGKLIKISSILESKFSWKLWHRFAVEVSTEIWLSKSTKYWLVLQMEFSLSLRRRINNVEQCWRWNYWNYILWKFCNNANKQK